MRAGCPRSRLLRGVQAIHDRDQRHEQRDDDEADGQAHSDDQDGFEQAHQGADQRVDFAVVGVGDFDQHLVQFAGFFTDLDHVHDEIVEDARMLERLGDRVAFFDRVVDGFDGVRHDGVVGRQLDDRERFENRHA